MTIPEIATQLSTLSIDGVYGDTKHSRSSLRDALFNAFREASVVGVNFTIHLSDGEWLAQVTRYNKASPSGFDYYIPETREAEARLKADLGI